MEKLHLLTVRLLGVETPLTYAVGHPEEVWDALQEEAWVSWEAPTGQAVHVRPAYVTAVHGVWEPSPEQAQQARSAPVSADVLVWMVGAREPLQVSFDTQTPEEWPQPGQLLQDESEWIGWSDVHGHPVMFQTQHLTALVYPAAYDHHQKPRKKKKSS